MILLQIKVPPSGVLKLLKFGPNLIQAATITGRASRGGPLHLQKPFPYEKKKFMWYHEYFDKTMIRVTEENAKIIVVEGPIAAGKTPFAMALAEQLDMHYLPPPTMDEFYLLPSGYDLRQHDHELPKILQSYDHKNFCVAPRDVRAGLYQIKMMYLRFWQYLNAMTHLLNTGQGVILERSYYSDYVFCEAMHNQKYISSEARKIYTEIYQNSGTFFLPPHLVIYLDVPVPVVQERICTRNYSYEQNSPALTKEYLTSLEKFWKQDYLDYARKNSEILVYDWSEGGDVEIVIEDIEKINFEVLRQDNRFSAWRLTRRQLTELRQEFTNNMWDYNIFFYFPHWKVPEFNIENYVYQEIDNVLRKIPECRYDVGYNYLMGDSIMSILFKSNEELPRKLKPYLSYFKEAR